MVASAAIFFARRFGVPVVVASGAAEVFEDGRFALSGPLDSESIHRFTSSSDCGSFSAGLAAPASVWQIRHRIAYWLIPTHVAFGRGHH